MDNFLDGIGLSYLISKIKSAFVVKADTTAVQGVDVDTTPTQNSSNLITSGGVYGAMIYATYTPTLQSAPTSSTTTYTKDGQTVDFEIGKFARVANVNSPSGYDVYQLVDLVTENNVTTATWVKVGDIFYAIYGTTTYSDLVAQFTAGKVVAMFKNGYLYIMTSYRTYGADFTGFGGNASPIKEVIVRASDNTYLTYDRIYENTGNKVTSWQITPDDTHYPSEKLVYDELGNIEDVLDAILGADTLHEQKKMDIVSASGTTLSAAVNTYYNFASEVNTLAVTLPSVTDSTHINNIVFMLTTGSTPAVTFTAPSGINVIAQDGFSIEASTTYEINAIFNGVAWVVAAMKLNTTDIQPSNP